MVRVLVDAHGETYGDEAGIALRNRPQALYRLLSEVADDGRHADAIAYDRPPEGYYHAQLLDHPRGDFDEAVAICQREYGDNVLPLYLPLHGEGEEGVCGLIGLLSQRVFDHSKGGPVPEVREPDSEHVPLIADARSALIEPDAATSRGALWSAVVAPGSASGATHTGLDA